MTNNEEKSLHSFSAAVRQLILQYKLLQDKCVQLQFALKEKDDEVAALQQTLSETRKNYADLKMAKMIEIGDGDVKDAKLRVSQLIREVDKCIAMLNV